MRRLNVSQIFDHLSARAPARDDRVIDQRPWQIGGLVKLTAAAFIAGAKLVERGAMRPTLPTAVVTFVWMRDRSLCRYCGRPATHAVWYRRRGHRDQRRMSAPAIDHVVPIAQGGGNELANLVVACFPCNAHKGPRTPEQAGMHLLDEPRTV